METTAARPPARLVIIDDHQMVLDGLQAMLRPYSAQVEIVGESSDARQAVRLVAELEPDAVLLDVRLRGTSGLDLCTEIRDRVPGCKVVFLTVYDDEQYLYQALRVGGAGSLLKRIRGGELVDHLQRIFDGEVLIDPALAGRVALSAARPRSGEFWPGAHLWPHPARERGAVAAGVRPEQPGDRGQAGDQRGDRQDALPRHLPQARGLRPGRRRDGGAARRRIPLTADPAGQAGPHRDVQLLNRVIETISAGLDLDVMLQGVTRLVTETTATDVCFLHLMDEGGGKLQLRGATPPFDSLVGQIELSVGEGVAGWVAVHGEPVVIVDDKTADPRYRYIPALRGEDYTSMVSVPVVTPLGHLVGVLNVHTLVRREFSPSDVDLLRSVAGLVAGAIENARLHHRLAEREEQLELFAEQTMEWQEHESRRLAGEIHDGISQRIVSLFFHLSAAADAIATEPGVAAEQVAKAQELASAALDETRSAIAGLRPPVLDDLGLAASLESLGRSLPQHEVSVRADSCRMADHIETAVYRTAQEAIAERGQARPRQRRPGADDRAPRPGCA